MGLVKEQVAEKYEVLSTIEKSKTGITYKVRNRSSGEVEAMRTLLGPTSTDPESMQRLLREIRIQARLAHPNVVAFHDAFEVGGQLVMTTEFVEGRTLAEVCREGPLDQNYAIEVILHLLDGLEEAHALGIVHRGITADHVVFDENGIVKLGGFGLAKPASDTSLTRVGAVMGDPRYISPEQITEQGGIDARSDLYSLGVLFYQMLTGTLPFSGASDFDVMTAQVISVPRSPSTIRPSIPDDLDFVVLKALRKNPAERFQNAKELRAALSPDVKTGASMGAHEPPGPQDVLAAAPAQQPSKQPFRSGLVWASALVLIGLTVIFWIALR